MLPDPLRGIWGGCRDSYSQVPGACSCPGDCVTSDKYIHQLNEVSIAITTKYYEVIGQSLFLSF